MNMDMTGDNTIRIELSESDLDELQISFEELDYRNAQTRRVVWTLLDRAKKKFNIDLDLSGKLLVEAFRTGYNDCVLVVTLQPNSEGRKLVPRRLGGLSRIFEFRDADALLGFSDQLRSIDPQLRGGELYSDGKKLRLVLGINENDDTLTALLSEYAKEKPGDKLSLSLTREHWKKIIENNALETICRRSL